MSTFWVTFYSYKGGVGRTTALANVAALLAANGRNVMMIDFDLKWLRLFTDSMPLVAKRNTQVLLNM